MSGFQRMIAIPQEEYYHMFNLQNSRQPLSHQMSQLENQYQQQAVQSKNPYEKMILQGSTLEEMKMVREKLRNDISLGTPKPYRNRALSLYRSIEPFVKFNERGELHDEDDKPIANSRAEDLIQHAVRDRRRQFTPVAWDKFVNVLKKQNIPKSSLNRFTIEEMENDKSNVDNLRTINIKQEKSPEKKSKPTPRKFPSKIPMLKSRPKRKHIPSRKYSKDFLTDF